MKYMNEVISQDAQNHNDNLVDSVRHRVTSINLPRINRNHLTTRLNEATYNVLERTVNRQLSKNTDKLEFELSEAVEVILDDVAHLFDEVKNGSQSDPYLLRTDRVSRRVFFTTDARYPLLQEDDQSLFSEERALALQYLMCRLVEPPQPQKPMDGGNVSLIAGVEDENPHKETAMDQVYNENRNWVAEEVLTKIPKTPGVNHEIVMSRIHAVEDIIDGMIVGPLEQGFISFGEISRSLQIAYHGHTPDSGEKPTPLPIYDNRSFLSVSRYIFNHPMQFRSSQQAITTLQKILGVPRPNLEKYVKGKVESESTQTEPMNLWKILRLQISKRSKR